MQLDDHGLIVRSAPDPIPGGPQTAAEVLDAKLRAGPDDEALVGRHRTYTYAQLDRAANQAANALQSVGIQTGDRVAVSLPNHCDIVVAFLGAMRLGAIWVGFGQYLAPAEIRVVLEDSTPSLLLCTPAIAAKLSNDGIEMCQTLSVDPATATGEWVDLVNGADATPLDVVIDPNAPAAIAYTSGTTGRPKGAVHTQHNMLWPGALARETDPAPPDERHGVVLALSILNMQILGPLYSFTQGETCVLIDESKPAALAEWIRSQRITRLIAVPTIFHDLLVDPDVDPADLSTLRRPECGGSHTPQVVRDLFLERFGQPVHTGYGLTEAPTSVARERVEDVAVAGSVGPPRAAVDIVILDDAGNELPESAIGEICIRARREGTWKGVYSPTLGYWNRPEATREALRGGVLHTDDLGELVDGLLFVKDRRTALIIRGGSNVYPAEVENVLTEIEGVAGAAAIGIPDERLGERVVALVEPEPAAELSSDRIIKQCRELMARFKVPEEIKFVEQLPRNAMGKIVKSGLRSHFDS